MHLTTKTNLDLNNLRCTEEKAGNNDDNDCDCILPLFQAMFVATAATIISGAVAERMKFVGYLMITILATGVIYPLVGHWAWSSSYLANIEITGIFKQTQQSVFKPKYFATEKTAKKWLDGEDEKKPKKQKQIEINYKGVNRQGKSVIEIKEDPSNINSSIQSLKSFLEDRDFIRINMTQFSSLSPK